eukprot:CAMPEP_0181425040 /NCGR_PEP_ID=MMETSP1110-20121109/14954_1 /TAXON_ID=174948 /ORGANISM="Symbiodinium sp., Strain CCMP421" /LENGTH=57 /DNA_ID=CAMNT_0023548215 /DNA_START=185 /DNA_END=358 /DNA_ORIENTATION=-
MAVKMHMEKESSNMSLDSALRCSMELEGATAQNGESPSSVEATNAKKYTRWRAMAWE